MEMKCTDQISRIFISGQLGFSFVEAELRNILR